MKCPSCHKDISDSTSFCAFCGAALVSPENAWDSPTQSLPLSVPDMKRGSLFFNRHEIIEELGKGELGTVFRVFDRILKREAVLRILKPEICLENETVERLKKELDSAGKIVHENVNRMYEFGQKHGCCYVTMEYVPGQDLRGLIRQTGHLSLPTAVHIAKQLCRGLAAAHRSGVIHCGLNSGCVNIDREGQVRILDFGMIRPFLHEIGGVRWGNVRNAPEYESPELAGESGIDLRTDIYSLGVILYEMVTGRIPFSEDTFLGQSKKNKKEKPLNPSEIRPVLPPELEKIIFKCLEKDKEKRYSSADDVYADLDRIDKGLSDFRRITSGRTTPESDSALNLRNPARILLWAVLTICVAAVFSFLVLKKKDLAASDTGMKMLAVLPFDNLGHPEDEYFSDGLSEEIMSRLAALRELGVISRTSAFHYKNTEKTIKKIGEELGVDFVLEGTVRWNRNPEGQGRVKVTVQLIRVADDTHLWAGIYERLIEDIFSVQTEIADQVIKKLDIAILEPERLALSENPTKNLDAFDAYLKARTVSLKGYIEQDLREYERAIELLNEAVTLDPDFLQAHLLLFDCHIRLYRVGLDRTKERLNSIRQILEKVQNLAPDSPEVQMIQGLYEMWIVRDYDRALDLFSAVQRVRPNLSPSYSANIHRLRGNWKACIANFERAFQLNPLSSDLAHMLGRCYAWICDYKKSEEWFNRALSIFPDLYYSKLGKARLPLLERGDTREARMLLEGLPEHVLTEYNWYELEMMERNFEDLLERLMVSPYEEFSEAQFYIPKDLALASVYSAMGNKEKMRVYSEEAQRELRQKREENPDDIRFSSALGLASAYAGNFQEAIREGERAVTLYPVSRDAFEGPRYILNLAKIYALVGNSEKAFDQLEFLFSIPCGNNYSIPLLRLDPVWDSLRRHPRFRRFLSASVHWQNK
jgi:serine/threonine protein kinase